MTFFLEPRPALPAQKMSWNFFRRKENDYRNSAPGAAHEAPRGRFISAEALRAWPAPGQLPGAQRRECVYVYVHVCVCVCMCVHECLCTGTYHTQLLITKQGSTSPRPVVLWILMPLPGDKAGTGEGAVWQECQVTEDLAGAQKALHWG